MFGPATVVIALPCDSSVDDDMAVQRVGEMYLQALRHARWAADLWPLLVPTTTTDAQLDALLPSLDGLLLTGAESNVHPSEYGAAETGEHPPFDLARDRVGRRLTLAALAQGVPLLGICRGLQELNVWCGGTLHAALHDLPHRIDHRAPPNASVERCFAPAHVMTPVAGGALAALVGGAAVQVNSLHRQGIATLAPRLHPQALADDGTVEAVTVADATAFALAVQWHPESHVGSDAVSNALFDAFITAARHHHARRVRAD